MRVDTYLYCLFISLDDQYGMLWLFVWIIDACEIFDLALINKLIETFDVASFLLLILSCRSLTTAFSQSQYISLIQTPFWIEFKLGECFLARTSTTQDNTGLFA